MRFARHVAGPLLGLVVAVALFPGTDALDRIAQRGQLGPGFWPRLVLVGFALACLAKLVEEWGQRRLYGQAADAPTHPPISWGKLAAGIALVVLYVLLAPYLGFPVVTAAFIATFIVLGGMRSPAIVGANVVVGTLGLIYLFVKVVYLPLPKGEGPFETFTLALYRVLRIF